AYMTLTGIFAPLRIYAAALTTLSPASIAVPEGLPRSLAVWTMVAALMLFALRPRASGRRMRDLAGGAVTGILIVAAWLVTGWLGADDFDPTPVASLSFVAPIGDTIQYSMIATGMSLRLGITVVLGVLAGSFLAAIARSRFRVEGFESSHQMPRYIMGGMLMGIGGSLALGCSIGQGLSGLSTLAYSSMISAFAIVIGSRITWKPGLTAS